MWERLEAQSSKSDREIQSIDSELRPPFVVISPRVQTSPFVFCSPHSGSIYPQAFLEASRLDAHTLRKSEDCFVDELFAGVVGGAVMDAAGSERAALLGISEGGPMSILFAATYPERVSALVLWGTMARFLRAPDYPYGTTPEQVAEGLAGTRSFVSDVLASVREGVAAFFAKRKPEFKGV